MSGRFSMVRLSWPRASYTVSIPPWTSANADPVGDQPPAQPLLAGSQNVATVVRSGLPTETFTREQLSWPRVRSVGHRVPGFAVAAGGGVTCASSTTVVGTGGLG